MRSKVAQRILDKTPAEVTRFVRLYADIVIRVNQILKEKNYTQKKLADKLEKKPSEIHKWLSGEHNFTLRSISKLEVELGETLLEVPVKSKADDFSAPYGKTTLRGYSNIIPKIEVKSERKYIRMYETKNTLANVG